MLNKLSEPIAGLLTPAETLSILGYKTKTNHSLRHLEQRGLLKPIRLSARTLRYDPRDVEKLIDGGRAVQA